jgi:hypothetical protein
MKIKTLHETLRWLPLLFYIFLASFLIMKFIFIFFLNASFTPEFIFELTPLFLLSGMNNLQLLFASLLIVMINAYLHAIGGIRFIKYSFVFTGIMISGIGAAIVTRPIGVDYLVHYLLFVLLLVTVMVDQRKLIAITERVTTREKPSKTVVKKPSLEIASPIKPLPSLHEETPPGDFVVSRNAAKIEPISSPRSVDANTAGSESPVIPDNVSRGETLDEKLREIEENIDKIMLEKEEKAVVEQIKEKHIPDIKEIVDPFYADILKNIGIVTVEDLVRQEPNELVKRMDDYILDNIDKYLEDPENRKKIKIDSSLVSNWIEKVKIFLDKKKS